MLRHVSLFKMFLGNNIVLRLLLYMNTKQTLQVKWGEHISEEFNVSNGVKQGGVLSPVLFSLYID